MTEEKKKKPHYVNNRDFSTAVNKYVIKANNAKANDLTVPPVTDYIGKCFLKISEGLSYRPNFIRYTYREEMIMDAVENCLKAINNYDIERATRTNKPNAFSYFTQISFYAFLRRLAKEKRQQNIRFRYIEEGAFSEFFTCGDYDTDNFGDEQSFVDELRARIDNVHKGDNAIVKEFEKQKHAPQGVELFMGDDEDE